VISEEINIRIKSFRIGERVDSDHLLLELEIAEKKRRGQEKRTRKAEERKIKEKRMKIIWDKMAIQKFKERTEKLCMIEEEEEQGSLTIEDKWIRIRQIVNEAIVKKEIRRKSAWLQRLVG